MVNEYYSYRAPQLQRIMLIEGESKVGDAQPGWWHGSPEGVTETTGLCPGTGMVDCLNFPVVE